MCSSRPTLRRLHTGSWARAELTIQPVLRRPSAPMELLTRLPWVTTHAGEMYGICIGIRTDNSSIACQLPEFFPYGWSPLTDAHPVVDRLYSVRWAGNGARDVTVYENARILHRGADVPTALHELEAQVKLFVATRARHRIFVHAGVVGWNGKAIMIPGPSYSGKTTLVSELVRAGATYYSDEFAVLDHRGRVHPYSSPLEVRGTLSPFQIKTPVEAFEGCAGRELLRLGTVLITQYEHDQHWSPKRLSTGEALLELLTHTPAMRRRPVAALASLENALRRTHILLGSRGEAPATASLILDWLSSQTE